jgi:nicotinamide mononucleotide transporter
MLDFLIRLFSADQVLIHLYGYDLSALELFSTLLAILSYADIIHRKLRGLVIGCLSSILLVSLFYQLRLYADMGLMLYYVGASIVAIASWQRKSKGKKELEVSTLGRRPRLWLIFGILLFIWIITYVDGHLHIWFPVAFPEPARFPIADAVTTTLGITASILLIRCKWEAMGAWLVADILALTVYILCGVYFLAIVYATYAIMDLAGVLEWIKCSRIKTVEQDG